ncbi:MAG: hypothetical protein HYZ42_10360, partial [Bacteroidetes bacterium]|nr:hypothetical protein [Bacteroidota bacterium]
DDCASGSSEIDKQQQLRLGQLLEDAKQPHSINSLVDDDVEFVDEEEETSMSTSSSSSEGEGGALVVTQMTTKMSKGVLEGDGVQPPPQIMLAASTAAAGGLSSEAREYWATIDFYNASKVCLFELFV